MNRRHFLGAAASAAVVLPSAAPAKAPQPDLRNFARIVWDDPEVPRRLHEAWPDGDGKPANAQFWAIYGWAMKQPHRIVREA